MKKKNIIDQFSVVMMDKMIKTELKFFEIIIRIFKL
jgi:hypothetical protein